MNDSLLRCFFRQRVQKYGNILNLERVFSIFFIIIFQSTKTLRPYGLHYYDL